MMAFGTDQILWYNNGVWGKLGFAVPNFGDNTHTLNKSIHHLVDVMGRNIQAIMLDRETLHRTPPSIDVLTRVHKLVLRVRSILAGRTKPPNELPLKSEHASPAPEAFIIYPTPYFKVKNSWMKEWCGLALIALSEAMQHTDNGKSYEITPAFAGTVSKYVQRIYQLMATELFGVPVDEAKQLDFVLNDTHFQNYDPGKWFTSTEMMDHPAVAAEIPTEDDLRPLTEGIPAPLLIGLDHYPLSTTGTADNQGEQGEQTSVPPFQPAPSP